MPRRRDDAPILTVHASAGRRFFALGMVGLLAGVLLYAGLFRPVESFGLRLMMIAMGTGATALLAALWQATGMRLELTEAGLREAGGRMLAPIERIEKVDRGMFAFKPSNGFLITLDAPQGRAWVPGMWWRAGRRVGVGGVLRGAEARAAADTLTAMLLQR